jgi:hypothetical protein
MDIEDTYLRTGNFSAWEKDKASFEGKAMESRFIDLFVLF